MNSYGRELSRVIIWDQEDHHILVINVKVCSLNVLC